MLWQRISFLLLLGAMNVEAADFLPDFLKEMKPFEKQTDGFKLATSLNLPFSFAHSQSRLGIASGLYVDIAGKAFSTLSYQKSLHSFGATILLAEGFSTSPSNDGAWDKSMDILRLESRYLHNTLPWLSLFAHARAETSVFKSVSRHDLDKNFEIRGLDDKIRDTKKVKELKLADPFAPIFLQENLGALATIFNREYLNVEAKTALSLRQTLAHGQMVLVKEEKANIVVRDLKNFYQFGFLLGAAFNGQAFEDKVAYRAGIDTTWPFWQTPKSQKTFLDSLIIEASAGIALKLTSFSSLQYEYTAVRLPEVLEAFQQNHLVNLNIGFDWLYSFGS